MPGWGRKHKGPRSRSHHHTGASATKRGLTGRVPLSAARPPPPLTAPSVMMEMLRLLLSQPPFPVACLHAVSTWCGDLEMPRDCDTVSVPKESPVWKGAQMSLTTVCGVLRSTSVRGRGPGWTRPSHVSKGSPDSSVIQRRWRVPEAKGWTVQPRTPGAPEVGVEVRRTRHLDWKLGHEGAESWRRRLGSYAKAGVLGFQQRSLELCSVLGGTEVLKSHNVFRHASSERLLTLYFYRWSNIRSEL